MRFSEERCALEFAAINNRLEEISRGPAGRFVLYIHNDLWDSMRDWDFGRRLLNLRGEWLKDIGVSIDVEGWHIINLICPACFAKTPCPSDVCEHPLRGRLS